jgi:anti-sigma regulatory factor (Ser/Thr protein kinase)
VGQWHANAEIPATPRGPAAARRVVAALLDAWGLAQLGDDAQLVASELVTNAYQHAPGTDSFDLELTGRPDRVTIALADGSAIRPIIGELNHQARRGRGLRLVAAVSARWGADDHQGGKRVWAEISTQATPNHT